MLRLVGVLVIIVILISTIASNVIAADGGVKQVSISVTNPEINPGDTVTISVTVVTGGADAWTGTITVTHPVSGSYTAAISGSGTATVSKLFPGGFSGNTNAVGDYSISVSANMTGQTAVIGEGSFSVKDWYLEVSSSPIVSGGNVSFTVKTDDDAWDGTVTVTEPNGSVSSVYTFATPQVGDTATTPFPGGSGWVGSAGTATVGTYTVTLDEGTSSGADDTATFDVQDASPHVGTGFGQTTYACAGCHRTHAGANAAKLLKSSNQVALCQSCHDGQGANTDVFDGVYLGQTQGEQDAGLRGGGFVNALMDTNVDGFVTSTVVSSKHSVGSTNPVAWGSGSLSVTAYAGEVISSLDCGNCHNPHGNSQYRILRPQPTGLSSYATNPVVEILASLETSKTYTIGYDPNTNYRDLGAYPAAVLSQISEWCGQCHQRYVASTGSGSTNSGDAIFKYRHMTDGLGGECLKCHVAHGTSAIMSGNAASGNMKWPNNTNTSGWQTGEDNYSRLLHIDNRGVCMQCHNTLELVSN